MEYAFTGVDQLLERRLPALLCGYLGLDIGDLLAVNDVLRRGRAGVSYSLRRLCLDHELLLLQILMILLAEGLL